MVQEMNDLPGWMGSETHASTPHGVLDLQMIGVEGDPAEQ
jgi:hypothetical protein